MWSLLEIVSTKKMTFLAEKSTAFDYLPRASHLAIYRWHMAVILGRHTTTNFTQCLRFVSHIQCTVCQFVASTASIGSHLKLLQTKRNLKWTWTKSNGKLANLCIEYINLPYFIRETRAEGWESGSCLKPLTSPFIHAISNQSDETAF